MSTDVTPGRVVSVVYNDEENLDALDRDRADALLERAAKLDGAIGNLQAFRSLLESLNARTPIGLPPPQVQAIEMVRTGLLRSAIALAVAILDSRTSDRASLRQMVEVLRDTAFVEFFVKKRGPDGIERDAMRKKLQEVCDRYRQIDTVGSLQWIREFRQEESDHLLMRSASILPVECLDVFALTDEIEHQAITLHEGLRMQPPHFMVSKEQIVEQTKLFWNTYFAGVDVLQR
jgi:hypothetical protein